MTNRFKGLDLTESAWRTMDGGSWYCTKGSDQDHPEGREMKTKIKILSDHTCTWTLNLLEDSFLTYIFQKV